MIKYDKKHKYFIVILTNKIYVMCSNKRNNYFKVFEKFIKFLDDNNKFLKKIYITHRDNLSLIKDIKK